MAVKNDATYVPFNRKLLYFASRSRKYFLALTTLLMVVFSFQMLFGAYTLPLYIRRPFMNKIDQTIEQFREVMGTTSPELERFLRQKKPDEPPCVKYQLVACAMVHNEATYIAEWIEFHRIQGVQHFILYDYFSTDLIQYISMIYDDLGMPGLVEIRPARFFPLDPKRDKNASDYYQHREWSMTDCYVRFSKVSQWLLLMDAGHFIYSTKYKSITQFIRQQIERKENDTGVAGPTAIKIPMIRFGYAEQQAKFKTWLTPNAYTGSADLLFEPYGTSPTLYPLVIDSNPNRAPHRLLDGKDAPEVPECANVEREDLKKCAETQSVTLVKRLRCPPGTENFTQCLYPSENFLQADLTTLRVDNHNWRALQHGQKFGKYWTKQHNATIEELNKSWFSSRRDNTKDQYVEKIRAGIAKLKPRIFYDVGRECRASTLVSGQQIMCPQSHPYPFGNLGIRYLRECCKTDKDKDGKQLLIESTSCENDAKFDCVDLPKMPKWAHRSCCTFTKEFQQKYDGRQRS